MAQTMMGPGPQSDRDYSRRIVRGSQELVVDADLIERYDREGPRYTSYPPITVFDTEFDEAKYRDLIAYGNGDPVPRPLSLYFHVPFCRRPCFFCACNKIVTRDRQKIERYFQCLLREIDQQAELFDGDRVVRQLALGGGTPTYLLESQIVALVDRVRERFRFADERTGDYSVEIDPRESSPGLLSVLRRCGFNRLSFGIQDFDITVQKAINRINSFEVLERLVSEARRLGFKSVHFDLIYGLPYQTITSYRRTLRQVIELDPDRVSLFSYAHLPSRFRPQRVFEKYPLPDAREKIDLMQVGMEELTDAGYAFVGMDHFAKPDDPLMVAQRSKKLHRNFQGYTTHGDCDLIGMGMSAISMTDDFYCQNDPQLDNYQVGIESSHLPIVKGTLLSSDDRLRREVIMSLMCYGEIDIVGLESSWGINFTEAFASELMALEPMIEDGLVRVERERLVVQAKGRILIRRIAMTFDSTAKRPQMPRLSRVI
jgi:oxygen-independent coproporphyrinogen-3 oxidase